MASPTSEYDLSIQKNQVHLNFKNEERINNSILRHINRVYFIICNSCYWCASYFCSKELESTSSQVLRCHMCNSNNTELIPISSNESFRIDYDVTRGMEMEFYRNNEIVDRRSQDFPEGCLMLG
jgi:hypothetical protein